MLVSVSWVSVNAFSLARLSYSMPL